ncbi:MAG: hypothetical protein QF536_10035 [Arenicellales bacterium]|nr:hypothetical protein [Arenicellales bacterium]
MLNRSHMRGWDGMMGDKENYNALNFSALDELFEEGGSSVLN